jgi:hypothetical protein
MLDVQHRYIRLKSLIEELDRPLHCIKNLDRRTNLPGLNKVAVPLAGAMPSRAAISSRDCCGAPASLKACENSLTLRWRAWHCQSIAP